MEQLEPSFKEQPTDEFRIMSKIQYGYPNKSQRL